MAENFKVGDLVRLKSGGPKMTVIRVGSAGEEAHAELKSAGIDLARYSDDQLQAIEEVLQAGVGAREGDIECTWFTKNDVQEQGTFPPEALERADVGMEQVRTEGGY